jgi:Holliday junction resolvase RusA-like endonuclease
MTATPQLALPLSVKEAGEIRVYRMTLPFLPPSKNEYDNWPGTWKSAAKKKWINAITAECQAQMMPLGVQKVGLAATLVFPSDRRRDLSNYAQALWNFVPDALQRAGVLVNDSDGHVQYGPQLGVKFAVDTRKIAESHRKRTIIDIAMRVV